MGAILEKYGYFIVVGIVLGAVYLWAHVGPGHHSYHYSPPPPVPTVAVPYATQPPPCAVGMAYPPC